jgi:RNA-binding protein YlmH
MPTLNEHLADRLRDLANKAQEQDIMTHTAFMTPADQAEAAIWLKKNRVHHVFSGGYPGSERQVCFLLHEDLAPADSADLDVADTISALRLRLPAGSEKPRGSAPCSHRDYLGSLLGLGIRRDQLGDILVSENEATILILASLAIFVETHLERVGRLPVQISPISLGEISSLPRNFTQIRLTASSLRLDKIAASSFGLPRSDMADQIRSGAVQVNWREELRPDQDVPVGAVISWRGHGRIRLASEEGLSRKEKHILLIERYL